MPSRQAVGRDPRDLRRRGVAFEDDAELALALNLQHDLAFPRLRLLRSDRRCPRRLSLHFCLPLTLPLLLLSTLLLLRLLFRFGRGLLRCSPLRLPLRLLLKPRLSRCLRLLRLLRRPHPRGLRLEVGGGAALGSLLLLSLALFLLPRFAFRLPASRRKRSVQSIAVSGLV